MYSVAALPSVSNNGETPYLRQAIAELRGWPSLSLTPLSNGVSFTAAGTTILHLTGRNIAQLHLTQPAIERLDHFLHTDQVSPSATGWITIRLDTTNALDLLLALVSVAIKANT